jgi:hypothetical protein
VKSPSWVPLGYQFERNSDQNAEDEPNAERIETYTRDFIIETLLKELEGAHFEHFIKVQCKRTVGPVGAPAVQALTGTLAPGGQELGLFVTLGAYSTDAVHLGRTRQDLGVVGQVEELSRRRVAWSRRRSIPWRRTSRPCDGSPRTSSARRCRRARPG